MQTTEVLSGSEDVELLLVIRVDGRRTGVLFPPGTENAFCVGSDPTADLSLESSQVRPIEFFWERQGPYLMLRPGYCGRQLKLNRSAVAAQVVMPEFARLEFGDCVLDCRLFGRFARGPKPGERVRFCHVAEAQLPPEPPLHSTVCLREDVDRKATLAVGAQDLSALDPMATVRVVLSAVDHSGACERSAAAPGEVTADIPVEATTAATRTAQTTTHVRAVQDGDYSPTAMVPTLTIEQPEVLPRLDATYTIELSSVDAAPGESQGSAPAGACNLGARLPLAPLAQAALHRTADQVRREVSTLGGLGEPVTGSPGIPGAVERHSSAPASDVRSSIQPTPSVPAKPIAAAERALPPASPPSSRKQPAPLPSSRGGVPVTNGDAPGTPRWQAPTTECSAVDWTAIPRAKAARAASESPPRTRPSAQLAQLGVWTRRRPLLAFGLALGLGLTAATVAVMIARLGRSAPSAAASVASERPKAQRIPTALPAEGLAKRAVADASPPAGSGPVEPASPAGSSRVIHQGPLGSSRELRALAAEHLAAGRHSDALRVFEQLQAQSSEHPAGKVIVKILKLRLSSDCDVRGQDVPKAKFCPEILP